MESKKVSVVCPMYNCEKFALKTVHSVLSQSYSNVELIIVDDCSKDKTVEIIRQINDERIRLLINEKNSGAAFSRNVALKVATGDYIAFLDGDDIWLPGKLEKQVSYMEENNYDFTYTDYELIDENDNRLMVFYDGPDRVNYKKFLRIDYIGTSTVIYKKDICPLLQVPSDIYKRNDDALWLTLSKYADCYRMPGIYSQYRKSSSSISSGSKIKLFKHHMILYKKLYNFGNFKSFLYASRNVFFYILKQKKYKKRLNR